MIEREEALILYRKLLLARRAEEMIQREYFNDGMKTPVHSSFGEEAIPVGVIHALGEGSKAFGTYRNHALYLALTEDTDGFFAELYGKIAGGGKGKAGSMHLSAPDQGLIATSAVVGSTIPLAVGAALANSYRHSKDVVAVFLGDGALEEGVFWESLNFACLRHLRVLFVCEDNGLAIHTPSSERQGFRSIEEVVQGFECHLASGDGAHLTEVISLARGILKQMNEDSRPGFLRFRYFRFLEHVGPLEDFNAGYRTRPTPEELARVDPVRRFENEICRSGCSSDELTAIKSMVDRKIARSVHAAQSAAFPPQSELDTDVLA